MLLFSYGSNTNDAHLRRWIPHNFVRTGQLHNYKLVFDHFGFANIRCSVGDTVHGTISQVNEADISKLKLKEFMYGLIDVNVDGTSCKAYQSLLLPVELGVTERYKDLVVRGYQSHGLPLPAMPESRLKLCINVAGTLFGIYLLQFDHPVLVALGLILVAIDGSMVIDELLETGFYDRLRHRHHRVHFMLFKIIPTFVMAPLIIYFAENNILRATGILFLLVDLLTLSQACV